MTKNSLILEIIRLEYGKEIINDYELFSKRFKELKELKKVELEEKLEEM